MDENRRREAREKVARKRRAKRIRNVIARGLILGVKPYGEYEAVYEEDVQSAIGAPFSNEFRQSQLVGDSKIHEDELKNGITLAHHGETADNSIGETFNTIFSNATKHIPLNSDEYDDYTKALLADPTASAYIKLGKDIEEMAGEIVDFFVVGRELEEESDDSEFERWDEERLNFYSNKWENIVSYFDDNNRWNNMTNVLKKVKETLTRGYLGTEPDKPVSLIQSVLEETEIQSTLRQCRRQFSTLKTRQVAEDTHQAVEDTHQAAEDTHQAAEDTRQVAEDTHQAVEDTHQAAEAATFAYDKNVEGAKQALQKSRTADLDKQQG